MPTVRHPDLVEPELHINKLHHATHEPGGTDPVDTSAMLATHTSASDPHPGYATDGDLATHAAAADPHPGYVLESLIDAAGDLIVGTANDTVGRLAKGTDGQVLTVDPTTHLLVWANPTSGFTNPMTTPADLIVGTTAGAAVRLAKGSDGQVLTVDPTTHLLVWATPSAGFVNPMTTQDDIIIGGAAGAAARLAKGADGFVLTVDPTTHHLVWAAAPGAGGGMTNPMTTSGDIIIGAGGGAAARLGIGTAGQVLTTVSGAPAWAAASGSGAKTYTDAFGTVGVAGPTSPTPAAGDVWLPPDTYFMAVYSGSAWVPRGPVYPMGMVDPSAFTDPASTGGTTDTTFGGLNLTAAANNQILRMRGKATPSTPYVITARVFIHAQLGGDGDRGGLYWRDSAGGHIQRCVLEWNSGSIRLASYENSDPSTFVQTLIQLDVPASRRDPHAWLRLSDDGTTRKFEVLVDGFHPVTVDSRGHTSLFTPNQVGLVAQAPNASSAVAIWLQSWKES